jgi:heterodisulfide reductase subunit D
MEPAQLIKIPCLSDLAAENKTVEYLFWVGSAGSYDDRAKKISRAFAKILAYCKISFGVLGSEESDSGDVARRAGNEFLFQMQAMQNIETLKMYQVTKIITCDPHDYNTLKNEYPDLGGFYEVWHHTEFLYQLIKSGQLNIDSSLFKDKTITCHDPCYLGRGNGVIDEPRFILNKIGPKLCEMRRNKQKSLCCGAGGAQMFKEAEKGQFEVYKLRTEEALTVNPDIIATACPFCMTMMTDGIKMMDKQQQISVLDIAELIVQALEI